MSYKIKKENENIKLEEGLRRIMGRGGWIWSKHILLNYQRINKNIVNKNILFWKILLIWTLKPSSDDFDINNSHFWIATIGKFL